MSSARLVRNKILVLGRRGVGKLTLVKNLLTLTQQGQKFPPQQPEDDNHSGVRIPWTISTKYYSADVEFWLDETRKDVDHDVIKEYESEENGIGHVVDAVIFVFQKHEPDTFDDIRPYLQFMKQYEPSIMLAVGTTSSAVVETEVLDDNPFHTWCLDNGFEYVDLEGISEDPEEPVGVHRILEALQSHMWDGLSRTGSSSRDKDPHELPYNDDNSGLDEDGDEDLFDGALPSQSEIDAMHQQLFSDFDDEDGLDKVFSRLHDLRERSRQLPDDERWRVAANVACSFGRHVGESI